MPTHETLTSTYPACGSYTDASMAPPSRRRLIVSKLAELFWLIISIAINLKLKAEMASEVQHGVPRGVLPPSGAASHRVVLAEIDGVVSRESMFLTCKVRDF